MKLELKLDNLLIPRDLSWLDFNERVLNLALRKDLPLLERFKFLSIVSSNFDEFFMVRVAALKTNKLSNEKLLKKISEKTLYIMNKQYQCLIQDIIPELSKNGLEYAHPSSWTELETIYLKLFFQDEVMPALTPLRFDDNNIHSVGGHSMYAAFSLNNLQDTKNKDDTFCIIEIPKILNRIIILPAASSNKNPRSRAAGYFYSAEESHSGTNKIRFALLDELALTFGGELFQGFDVKERLLFKINRDADFSVDESRDNDFVEAMEEVIIKREKSNAVRMVFCINEKDKKQELADIIAKKLQLDIDDIYRVNGPFDLGSLLNLTEIHGFDNLKDANHKIWTSLYFEKTFDASDTEAKTIWDRIRENDIFLIFPYQSFDPVVEFFTSAANDPDVIAIKTTLYRTSGDSPIVKALLQAALNGKQVTAVVELKARFDEQRNISWAKNLEKAGVLVVYGLAHLKVHAKAALIVRLEGKRTRRYLHLSTGNYNDKTAKLYSDVCLFTAHDDFVYDAGLFFNMITGCSSLSRMRRLIIAPMNLKSTLINLIEREIKKSTPEHPGVIKAKLNSLVDPDIIAALYKASSAGVKIKLNIRGICCLLPQVKEVSENIIVVSIVDHYLEHSRIIYFENGGEKEIFLSSADWMPRNLERRVELMFPVLDETIKLRLNDILDAFFLDNCNSSILKNDGTWESVIRNTGGKYFHAQEYLEKKAEEVSCENHITKQEFIVRRN